MKKKDTFQRKLKRHILLNSTLLVVTVLVLFLSYVFFYTDISARSRVERASQTASKKMIALHSQYVNRLQLMKHQDLYVEFVQNEGMHNTIFFDHYAFDAMVESELVLLDDTRSIIFSSFVNEETSNQMQFLVKVLMDSLDQDPNESVSSAYYFQLNDKKAISYTVAGTIMEDDSIVGYVFYFLCVEDINRYMRSENSESVIVTNRLGSVIAISNPQFLMSFHQFRPLTNQNTYVYNDLQYAMHHMEIPGYQFHVYSLLYQPNTWTDFLPWCIAIMLFGVILIVFANYFADKIAAHNSKSIEVLLAAADEIKIGKMDYRISLPTGDAFEHFANQFNDMVARVDALHLKNVELVDIRRVTEIRQLEAQMNPHFLYNTLETIRYSMLLDSTVASNLILKLTKILRYSINNHLSIVSLEEDLQYTHDFLDIQSYRFQSRFHYEMDVKDDCRHFLVPKLVLQPLIENSCKYGFIERNELSIWIKAYREDGYLYLSVEDNGMGIAQDTLFDIRQKVNDEQNVSDHIGLHNIKRRIVLLFGEDSDLEISSVQYQSTKVVLKFAVKEGNYV